MNEKFIVLYKNEEEFNLLKSHYNKSWMYVNNGFCGYISNDEENNWIYSEKIVLKYIKRGYTLLSFIDWEKLVLNINYEIY